MRQWTSQEDEFLIQNWLALSIKKLAETLERPEKSIEGRGFRLRLRSRRITKPVPVKVYIDDPIFCDIIRLGIPLNEHKEGCCWPVNRGRFCGDQNHKKDYCEYHYLKAYKEKKYA